MAITRIKFKRSATAGRVPTVMDIDYGELAINTFDGKLYTKKNDGVVAVVEIGASGAQYVAGPGIAIDSNNVISSTVVSVGAAGRIQTSNGFGGFAALPLGTTGQVLTSTGAAAVWSNPAPSGVTSVDASGGLTGLAFQGGPITTSGTLTLSGTLAIANGGTNATTATQALTNLLPPQVGTAGQVLMSNGTNATWQPFTTGSVTSVDASGGTTGLAFSGGPITTAGVLTLSGTLSILNGGTGATNAPAALTNLLPVQTGQAGKVLTTNGSVASWQTSVGGVTSVNVSGGSTGLSFSGGPITSTGTMTMAGTLALSNGGTGVTTLSALQGLLFPDQTGNTGKYLMTNGSTMSWQPVSVSPGGSTGQVQYNNGGTFAGSAGMTFASNTLTVTNIASTTTSNLNNISAHGSMTCDTIAVGASSIDCSQGNYFTKVATGALTWTFINPPASGRAYIFMLRLQNGGLGTQTWPGSVVWQGATVPTLSTSGYDLLLFETDNGGSSWRGAALLGYAA